MVDGVVHRLDDLLVPVLAVFGSEQDVVHVNRAVKLLRPVQNTSLGKTEDIFRLFHTYMTYVIPKSVYLSFISAKSG